MSKLHKASRITKNFVSPELQSTHVRYMQAHDQDKIVSYTRAFLSYEHICTYVWSYEHHLSSLYVCFSRSTCYRNDKADIMLDNNI